eukprot:scaffold27087_cov74-Phaeocystis_antarctica.AAC.7
MLLFKSVLRGRFSGRKARQYEVGRPSIYDLAPTVAATSRGLAAASRARLAILAAAGRARLPPWRATGPRTTRAAAPCFGRGCA